MNTPMQQFLVIDAQRPAVGRLVYAKNFLQAAERARASLRGTEIVYVYSTYKDGRTRAYIARVKY